MRYTFDISFYCGKSKVNKKGLAPIELSVSLNGERKFINLPMTMVENPLETDPGIPLVIDPPILFFSSNTQMQAVGIKNRFSLHSA